MPGRLLIAAALAAAALAAFWPVLGASFLNYDDDVYVTKNRAVQGGLTAASLEWAWTTTHGLNWHPLTWMSHMLDWQLFGDAPFGHHLVSLLLHVANTLLLFDVLRRMTGATGRSALVAALFGVHPLHVESVAWISERKDVLSTLFGLLAMLAYARYARSPGVARYAAVVLAFGLGLAAKPMLVTLPFVLLLLDHWPLGRIGERGLGALVREKLPLLALSAGSCAVTYAAQSAGGGIASGDRIALSTRLANAVVSYAAYLGKAFWPRGLAIFYPHPLGTLPAWKVLGAAVLLVSLTALALSVRRLRPYVPVGWLWYLGTLVPVIGVVQVGGQAMADRYTYLPLVGIFVVVAWGVHDLVEIGRDRAARGRRARPEGLPGRLGLAAPGVLAVLALAPVARYQAGTWKDSTTLFAHAVAVTDGNYKAHTSLGSALAERGRLDEAIAHYEAALRINPGYPLAHNDLGIALAQQGRIDEAISHYQQALRGDPSLHEAHNNLGNALARKGRLEEALAQYAEALRLDPEDPLTHFYWGTALSASERWGEAADQFALAIRLRPEYAKAHSNLAAALYYQGKYAEAWDEIARARRYGFEPPGRLVELLAQKMPPPGTGR